MQLISNKLCIYIHCGCVRALVLSVCVCVCVCVCVWRVHVPEWKGVCV